MSATFEEFRLYTTVSIKTQSASATTKRALIDTGCVMTIINKKFLQYNNIELEHTDETISTKSVHSKSIHKKYKALIVVDNVEFPREVIIMDDIEHDIILGMDVIMFSDFYIHYNGTNDADFDFSVNPLLHQHN